MILLNIQSWTWPTHQKTSYKSGPILCWGVSWAALVNKKICSSDWKQSTLCCAPPTAALCSLLYRSTLSLSSIEYTQQQGERTAYSLFFVALTATTTHPNPIRYIQIYPLKSRIGETRQKGKTKKLIGCFFYIEIREFDSVSGNKWMMGWWCN